MSVAKLTLRPPPNIDFVQGYPGIPPGAPDRPQAAVKGTIEFRVGPQGVKAKWVRIELRKVEVLPGGGVANTFYDPVGQSPISVWQAREEYGVLTTQDFPFYIRIPESIPPSIALEKSAGIKYELIATVCVKGKKGLLRRDKPTITSTAATIIIDKHELHSTWPVYRQPETRSQSLGGVTLTVDRSHTCYGPGDRIALSATVKTEALRTEILRGYEFTLRETMVFRSGGSGKRHAPIVKTANISEQKVPVNLTLYGGTQHKAELAVTIPQQHTSATLNAARHIDITYILVVKALVGSGQHVTMELPVIVSNWPRAVSVEAMRRIGKAPNVSLPGQGADTVSENGSATPQQSQQVLSLTAVVSQSNSSYSSTHPYAAEPEIVISHSASGNHNTAPAKQTNGHADTSTVDEFGVNHTRNQSVDGQSSAAVSSGRDKIGAIQTIGGTQVSSPIGSSGSFAGVIARPRAASARAQGSRLTITNLNEKESDEHAIALAQASRVQATRSQSTQNGNTSRAWVTAEEEKKRLYEAAVAGVERVQGIRPRSPEELASSRPATATTPSASTSATPATNGVTATPSKPTPSGWLTAEEEKARLFNQAQAAVARTQGLNGSVTESPAPSIHGRSDSVSTTQHGVASYSAITSSGSQNAATSPQTPPPIRPRGQYPSAEEEKAAMRRFYEAKSAVQRTQGAIAGMSLQTPPPSSAPTAYDVLYPQRNSSPGQAPANDSPPPFTASYSPMPMNALSEKEQIRRAYAAQDAAALATNNANGNANGSTNIPRLSAVGPQAYSPSPPPSVPDGSPSRPAASPVSSTSALSAVAEKEMLRRRFEAHDNAALSNGPPPVPPPRSTPHSPGAPASRPTPTPPRSPPVPPASPTGSWPLTAAEEKARLKAQYETEDRVTQGYSPHFSPAVPVPLGIMNGFHSPSPPTIQPLVPTTPPPPPPLAPRPPKEYIQETQEEDMRTHARLQAIDREILSSGGGLKSEPILSSFSADYVDAKGNPIPAPGPPPPLA